MVVGADIEDGVVLTVIPFHQLVVLAGAQQQADGGPLMGLLHIAIQSFEIEAELAQLKAKFSPNGSKNVPAEK